MSLWQQHAKSSFEIFGGDGRHKSGPHSLSPSLSSLIRAAAAASLSLFRSLHPPTHLFVLLAVGAAHRGVREERALRRGLLGRTRPQLSGDGDAPARGRHGAQDRRQRVGPLAGVQPPEGHRPAAVQPESHLPRLRGARAAAQQDPPVRCPRRLHAGTYRN
jgi:hypothetical protein